MKNKLEACPMCGCDLPPNHKLRKTSSLMASQRWAKTTKADKMKHIEKMNKARLNKAKSYPHS